MDSIARSVSLLAVPAAREQGAASRGALTWPRAVVGLVLVIWLIPIKSYALPVQLPFNMEPYRLFLLAIAFVWLVGAVAGSSRFSAADHGAPIVAMVVASVVALMANRTAIVASGLETQAVKSFSFFLSYSIAFLIVTSTLSRIRDVEPVLKAIALGAALVSVAAVIESNTQYNLFDHIHTVLPLLDHIGKDRTNFAGGALRVRASAQHPIALGAALVICVPLVVFIARRAETRAKRAFWLVATGAVLMGALATESRTVVLALIVMLLTAIRIWGRRLLRYWPLLVVLAAVTHVAAPGVVSHLYKRFNPKGGIIEQQQIRAGQRGSGRIADLGPGLARWSEAPVFGHGLGTTAATGDTQQTAPGVSIIYDDQYMNTLVSLGGLGLLGVVWFVWGAAIKLVKAARAAKGEASDLIAVCAVSCTGFAAAMFTFDAFSFVQVTLLFFIIAALGLRARASLRG